MKASCPDTVAQPDPGNTWECKECGAEALMGIMTLDEAIEETLSDCKREWERWALDERDKDLDVLALLEVNLGRKVHPSDMDDILNQKKDIK